jgi:hypothetical protein
MAHLASMLACVAVSVALASADTAVDTDSRLLAAAARGDAAAIAALLRAGADRDARNDAGRPALLAAAASGRPEAVRALLRAGANVDAADRGGWTGLHEAAQRDGRAVARLLLEAGAAPDLRARSGGTPLDVAERAGHIELARLLRAHGARGSGKSIGDAVCVRPWRGDGYCAVIEGVDEAGFQLRVSRLVGCADGCEPDAACSAGQPVGPGGLGPGDTLAVPASCLTHTGME